MWGKERESGFGEVTVWMCRCDMDMQMYMCLDVEGWICRVEYVKRWMKDVDVMCRWNSSAVLWSRSSHAPSRRFCSQVVLCTDLSVTETLRLHSEKSSKQKLSTKMLSTMHMVLFSYENSQYFLEEKLSTKMLSTMHMISFSYENSQHLWTKKPRCLQRYICKHVLNMTA